MKWLLNSIGKDGLGLLLFLLTAAFAAGCTDLDDVNGRIDKLGNRLTQLEALARSANEDFVSLQKLVALTQERIAVAKLENTESGYKITLSDGTVLNVSKSGPGISVVYDKQTGSYYWTVGGETVCGSDGKPFPINGKDAPTPRLEIGAKLSGTDTDGNPFVEDNWYLSVDQGTTWVKIPASQTGATPVFKSVQVAGNELVLTFQNDTVVRLPYVKDFLFKLSDGSLEFLYEETIELTITQSGVTATQISKPGGWKVSIEGNKLIVTAPVKTNPNAEAQGEISVAALSASGYLTMATLQVSALDEKTNNDLSKAGTANCYVVSKAGKYSFTPTMGNSSTPLNAQSADWLWMSSEGLVSNVRYEDGTVKFTASASKGNAVIALCTGTAKTILWTYHIWLTDKPAEQKWNINTWLDRNLGASSAEPGSVASYGMHYQWGRKDPLPETNTYKAGDGDDRMEGTPFGRYTAATVNNPAFAMQWIFQNSPAASPSASVGSPMTFFSSGSDNRYAWLTDPEHYLWTAEGTGKKAIYDPCPAGYRVPPGVQLLEDFVIDRLGAGAREKSGATVVSNGRLYETNGIRVWIPAGGYRSDGILYSPGRYGYYWSGTSNAGSGTFFDYGRLVYFGEGAIAATFNMKERAFTIRCVKE